MQKAYLILLLSLFSIVSVAQIDTTFYKDYKNNTYKIETNGNSFYQYQDDSLIRIAATLNDSNITDFTNDSIQLLKSIDKIYQLVNYKEYEDLGKSRLRLFINNKGEIIKLIFLDDNKSRCSNKGRWIFEPKDKLNLPINVQMNENEYIELILPEIILQCYCMCSWRNTYKGVLPPIKD